MHCSSCGSYVAPGVRFCSNCGSATDDEATRLARMNSSSPAIHQDDDLEHTIFTAKPTLVFIKFGYLLAMVAAILLVFLLATVQVPAYISILLALALLLIPAFYHLRRNTVRYTLTDAKLEIDTGLIARKTRNIPLSKIQDVTVVANVSQRLLRFGDVVIDNASELGGSVTLHNINNPRYHADLILRELRRWH